MENIENNQTAEKKEVVLPTQCLHNTKPIIYNEQEPNTPNRFINKRVIILSVLLLVLTISVLRLPYIGSFIDALAFEYLFGICKYIIYGFLYVILIGSFFSKKFLRLLTRPKFIISEIIIIIGFCVLVSTINMIITEQKVWGQIYSLEDRSNFVAHMLYYHTNHFVPYLVNRFNDKTNFYSFIGNSSPWFINSFITWGENNFGFIITGGLIGEFVISAYIYFFILIAVIIFLTGFLFLTSNSKKKIPVWCRRQIVKIFGGKTDDIITGEFLKKNKKDIKVNKVRKDDIKMAAQQEEAQTPPFSFLTDTSVDNYQANKNYADKVNSSIISFIKEKKFNISYSKTIVMPLFSEIYYDVDNQTTIDNFLKNELEFAEFTKLKEFNVSFRGTELRIEFINPKPSKVSIKNILSNNNVEANMNNALIGYRYPNSPLFINLASSPTLMIVGKKGSGSSMLLSCLILTYSHLSDPSKYTIDIISKEGSNIFNSFKSLPHIKSISMLDMVNDNIGNVLQKYNQEIIERKNLFNQCNANNIEQYNQICTNVNLAPLDTKLLIFNDFDQIIKNNFQYLSLLRTILVEGKNYGIRTVLVATSVNSEVLDENIYNNIQTKLILKLGSENESLQIFDNYRGSQLYGNGDGYIFNESAQNKSRFQTCYLNQAELNQIIKIITTFYQAKSKS